MAEYVIAQKQDLVNIAEAIRSKTGKETPMSIYDMPKEISSVIAGGEGEITVQSKTVDPTESQQIIMPDYGYNALSSVTVQAISSKYIGSEVEKKEATVLIPTSSEQIAIEADTYATGAIVIEPVPVETKTVTSNGTYEPTSGKWFSSVTVNVPTESGDSFTTQTKTVSPTESQQTITPDSGYDALSSITVNAISSTYVGSGVTKKEAATITPNSSEQTAVASGVYTTGAITVAAVPTETKNITSNGTHTPASGKYFSSVTVQVPSEEFTTQTKTITPTKSQQTVTPDNGYDGLSSVTVDAIPNEYITTSDANAVAEDLAEGKTAYVNGQKITGTHTCSTGGGGIDTSDATAAAEDIAQGKTAYVNNEKITGTMVVQSFYTLDSTPSSDFGNEGDICVVRIGG